MNKLIFLTLLTLIIGCGQQCNNKIISQFPSPDGKYEATAFIRDCGVTTDFSPQVYIGPKGEQIKGTGNVFIGNHSDQIRIQWNSSTELKIFSECDVSMIVTNYQGIAIQFVKSK